MLANDRVCVGVWGSSDVGVWGSRCRVCVGVWGSSDVGSVLVGSCSSRPI